MEVRMAARLAILLLIVATVSTFGQTDIQTRIARKVDAKEQRASQVVVSPGPDVRAARLQMFNRDVSELTALSQSVQSDLRQLQRGVLVKDLDANLKRLEKLSKKLRREMQ
jgi:hypothetical protein